MARLITRKPSLTIVEKLSIGITMVQMLRETGASDRAISKLKINLAKELAETRFSWGLSPEETQLLHALMHA